jgi:hypothetical protein
MSVMPFDPSFFGIGKAKVSENIAAAYGHLFFAAHFLAPLP